MIAGEETRRAVADAAGAPLLIRPDGTELTGHQVEAGTTALALALRRQGLAGQRIGLWSWNSAAAIEAHLATEWIGATRVPVDPGAPPAEAAAVFEAAKVAGVLVDAAHAADAPAGALVHDDDAPLGVAGTGAAGTLEPAEVPPGTTHLLYPRMAARGQFLAVPISYANWAACMAVNIELYWGGGYGPGFGPGERFLTVQQIMHGTGMLGTFPFLWMGLPQIVLPRFDAAAVLDAAQRLGATATFFVPGMVTRLADAVAQAGVDRAGALRRVIYGGAPMPADDLVRAINVLGPVLVQVYGRFEGGWPLAVLGQDDHRALAAGDTAHAGSCGRPIAQTGLRTRPVPGQQEPWGELSVRNPMVVAGWADPDGWCGLGDLARLDGDGYLYLGPRLDGMINTGSYHVYPREVEEAIAAVAGVREALVRGEPDPVWGQAVTAYVVGDAVTADIRRALEGRLAKYKIPKRIELVAELP
ncbi:MAG TPA: AMP-binding protein [Streptosporangiaceae bacterium]|jgi:acyl-CoA synthetase (AMP-forming)/AMP-acid ligase II|nr:AMP-binding protein [Streptosporangiaceae bacterium]